MVVWTAILVSRETYSSQQKETYKRGFQHETGPCNLSLLHEGDWKSKSTLDRTEFLLWLLTKSKEALLYSKDSWALTRLPCQQVKMGTLWFQRVCYWEAAFGHSFPDKRAMNSICPLECKAMVPTANPPLPAGGQLVGSWLQLRVSRLLPLWDT